VVTYDVLSDLDTIKAIIKEAKAHLNNGEIQKARPQQDYRPRSVL
jgi:hypothetical protein